MSDFMRQAGRCLLFGLAVLIVSRTFVLAQNLLPNPGFENGTNQPDGWTLSEAGLGEWSSKSHQGHHGVSVRGTGRDSSVWRSTDLRLQPGGLYCLRFYGRLEPGATGGCVVAGTSRVNRDFRLTDQWQEYHYVFCQPVDGGIDRVRLGQWELRGEVCFDDVELWPVRNLRVGAANGLGEGESREADRYVFEADYGWAGANYHPCLLTNRCGFNSDRWTFSRNAEVVYRHQVEQSTQTTARLKINLNYFVDGELQVEASRDSGVSWLPVTVLGKEKRQTLADLPAALFPAQQILIRLAATGLEPNFQVNAYRYEAGLAKPGPEAEGKTRFLEVLARHPDVDFDFELAPESPSGAALVLVYQASNHRASTIMLQAHCQIGTNRPVTLDLGSLPPGLSSGQIPIKVGTPGFTEIGLRLTEGKSGLLFAGQWAYSLGMLQDPRPGYWLANSPNAVVWWCESGWKIGRSRPAPTPVRGRRIQPIQVELARGEYEPAQIVLQPKKPTELRRVAIGPFEPMLKNRQALSVQWHEVAYVHVRRPTDATGERGWYPDPLPPLETPLALTAGQNQPLWLTIHADEQIPPGDYRATVELLLAEDLIRVPLVVHVHDFTLPKETHLRSSLGLDEGSVNRYHGLTNPAQRQIVYEKYLENFKQHRISPYSFFAYAPMDIRFEGAGAAKRARVDFTRFDQAASRWLGPGGFNSFVLPLRGMGGGTYQSRSLGELEGFKEGTPEHARLFKDYLSQIEAHLRERGWLDKAYTYWFDEPDPKDYEFVNAGMRRLQAAAPGIKRMLTEQPERALMGNVDIWCGLTPEWTADRVRERRQAGEEVWWYICCAPKAPYVTEFIDHPGTELRLWPWQSWQYGVQGILIWATTYWNSPLVYRDPQLQDPWQDPMSYVSGYDFPVGHVDYWGNGDGRLLYPPPGQEAPGQAARLGEPVNSCRWENLRDGLEDYEYFWLLQQQIERWKSSGRQTRLLDEARQLLTMPPSITQDLTHFTDDPRLMLEHRKRVAAMIERLRKQ